MSDNVLARIGVPTISDRASAGKYEDLSPHFDQIGV
jgi:hypothetical protein